MVRWALQVCCLIWMRWNVMWKWHWLQRYTISVMWNGIRPAFSTLMIFQQQYLWISASFSKWFFALERLDEAPTWWGCCWLILWPPVATQALLGQVSSLTLHETSHSGRWRCEKRAWCVLNTAWLTEEGVPTGLWADGTAVVIIWGPRKAPAEEKDWFSKFRLLN